MFKQWKNCTLQDYNFLGDCNTLLVVLSSDEPVATYLRYTCFFQRCRVKTVEVPGLHFIWDCVNCEQL